jgi:soluble cytochrome b562
MRIGNANALTPQQGTTATHWQQNFKAMSSAIQSGNLGAAKSAYTALNAGKTPPPNSPMAQLGQALSSGNVASAQKALQNVQASRNSGHHNSLADAAAAPPAGATFGSSGTLLNVSA